MKYYKIIILMFLSMFLIGCTNLHANEQEKMKNKRVAQLNLQLGMGYLEKGNIKRAKQKLMYAIEKDPKLPEAWYSLAYFHEVTGNTFEAKRNYLKAIDLAPKRGDSQNNYGTFLCHNGEYQKSITHFIAATKDPQYLDASGAFENAGICALKIPDKKQALQYFTLALEQDPTREDLMTQITKLRG